jgi:penicillin-binding protein 2
VRAVKFGKIFGENIRQDSDQRGRGSIESATGWLDGLHPLLRRSQVHAESQVTGEGTRILVLLVLLFLSLFVLGIRLTYLALFRGEEYFLAAEGNRIVSVPVYPDRGVITDRYGEVIASNRPGFRVVADPRISLDGADLDFLAEILGKEKDEVEGILREGEEVGFASVSLGFDISRDLAVKIEANEESLLGVSVETVPLRNYPYPLEFAHVLGFVGEIDPEELDERSLQDYDMGDWVGKSGLEGVYEDLLQGQRGKRVLEKDVVGRVVREVASRLPEKGSTLVTTLDLPLQQFAYQSLARWVNDSNGKGGALVVSDVNTGEILGLVSYPSFDPSSVEDYLNDEAQPLFNRAVAGTYPPGSTFKLVTGTAALEEGVVDRSTVIWDRGAISVGPYIFYNWQRSGFGPLTFIDALSWSSDVYFYTVAGGYGSQPGVGADKLAVWARKYGLGDVMGIDLLSETRGVIPDPEWKKSAKGEPWFLGDTYHMGIGQGDVLLTPLQLNMVTATVANGGKRLQPHLAFSYQVELEGVSKVASEETLDLIRQGMRKSMTDGPNRFGNSSVVAIAGKTGTAENPSGDPHSWFTAFAPYEDPRVAVTVLVEGGARLGAYHPSVRVVKEILEWWFTTHKHTD